MLDDETLDALFDQAGEFKDQESCEAFVEGYRPQWAYHPDELDDDQYIINVDSELIGDEYLDEGRYLFDEDFEAAVSSIWHFGKLPQPRPIHATFDSEVRASPFDYFLRSGAVRATGHPLTCGCPACEFWADINEDTVPYLRPAPPPQTDIPDPSSHPLDTPFDVDYPPEFVHEWDLWDDESESGDEDDSDEWDEGDDQEASDVWVVPPQFNLPTIPQGGTARRKLRASIPPRAANVRGAFSTASAQHNALPNAPAVPKEASDYAGKPPYQRKRDGWFIRLLRMLRILPK